MNEKIVTFPDRSAIAEEAADWLILLDREQAPSAAKLAELSFWLDRSPVHREELLSLATLWEKMNVLTELSVPLGKVAKETKRATRHGQFFAGRFGWAMGTALLVVVAVTLVLTPWLGPDPTASNGLYSTAIGQQQTATLADGSVVLLNTNTQIRVSYGEKFRDIHLLQGEAHFEVADDAGWPLRVYAGSSRVEAVGTAFSVYMKLNAVDVTVTEGRVALASFDISASESLLPETSTTPEDSQRMDFSDRAEVVNVLGFLDVGQGATIRTVRHEEETSESTLDNTRTIGDDEMSRRLSWREGVLIFSGDSLESVVAEISRYTTITIEVSDPEVRAIKIGGRFPVGETQAMFDAFETNFGLRVTQLDPTHVLVASADSP